MGAIYLGNDQKKHPGRLEGPDFPSQAVCPSFPELQIHLDTCSEFRSKHVQWNSYFMRLLLGHIVKEITKSDFSILSILLKLADERQET